MYRKLLVLIAVAITILSIAAPTYAISNTEEATKEQSVENYRPQKIYALDLYNRGFGLKEVIGFGEPGWHLTLNAEGNSSGEIKLQVGTIYRIPASLLVWRFYGGGGLQYRQMDQSVAPYVLVGSEFVQFFFTEHGFTFESDSERFNRGGIRFRF